MKSFVTKFTTFLAFIRAFFPSEMPQGVSAHKDWANSIISIYGFPDNDSVRFALASMVLHDGPMAAYRSKFRYALMVKAGAAKQVASHQFTEIKLKQQAEATASQVVASNAQTDLKNS